MKNTFFTRIQQTVQPCHAILLDIDKKTYQWNQQEALGKQQIVRLKKSALITSTGASTRIEGASLSDTDVEKLLRGVSIDQFKDRDVHEVQGYIELLNHAFEDPKSFPLTESTIKFFHKDLLQYVENDREHLGKYKQKDNTVAMIDGSGKPIEIIFETTSPWQTPIEMQELVEWTQSSFLEKTFHPLLLIGNFIVELLHIHPFTDGNGRLSRILTNLLLMQQQYFFVQLVSHEHLIEKRKVDYYLSLRNSQKTFRGSNPELQHWMMFFLHIVNEQADLAMNLISKDQLKTQLSPAAQKILDFFDSTQGEITPKQIQAHTQIPRPTINQALNKLLRLGMISRLGQGRATRYRRV